MTIETIEPTFDYQCFRLAREMGLNDYGLIIQAFDFIQNQKLEKKFLEHLKNHAEMLQDMSNE